MMVEFQNLINIALSFFAGMLTIYFTAYSKTKGTNRALKDDLARLENNKQEVIKQHSLDFEKRKYQYEGKRIQFTKFFAVLDEFHGKCNTAFVEDFQPIMNEFMNSILASEDDDSTNELIKFNNDVQVLFNELNKEVLKITAETNSIRLISSPEIDKLLNELESAVKTSTDDATTMMKFMLSESFIAAQSLIEPLREISEKSGQNLLKCRDALRNQMKVELDDI